MSEDRGEDSIYFLRRMLPLSANQGRVNPHHRLWLMHLAQSINVLRASHFRILLSINRGEREQAAVFSRSRGSNVECWLRAQTSSVVVPPQPMRMLILGGTPAPKKVLWGNFSPIIKLDRIKRQGVF